MNGTNKKTAATILMHLGGNRFKLMTGAKNFAYGRNELSFKIGRNKTSCNYVQVLLDDNDTYTIIFSRFRAMELKTLKTFKSVYCDMLQDIFTEFTGLQTLF